MEKVGIIAGTGFYSLPALAGNTAREVTTEYGSALLTSGVWNGVEIEFLTRHGVTHNVPPSGINYRANIKAFEKLGIKRVIAINVVGGIDPTMKAGDLELVTDFIDFTSGRDVTFYDGVQDGGVKHFDVVGAYDKEIRAELKKAADSVKTPLRTNGVMAVYNGPRFETPAEIRLCALAGATVVGMTGYPEVSLAVEAGIRFAGIAVVANPAAGVSDEVISHEEITKVITNSASKVLDIIDAAIVNIASL
jgi:purine nucleoside phosphorylase